MCVKVPFVRGKYNNIIGYNIIPRLMIKKMRKKRRGGKTRLDGLIFFKVNINIYSVIYNNIIHNEYYT